MVDLEHPDITYCLRTGYPSYSQVERHFCGICGVELTESTSYEDDLHDYLCRDCLCESHEKEW